MMNMMKENKNILLIVLAVAVILLLPLLAMQFTDEVAWGVFDFVTAGVLLLGTGLAYELISRKTGTLAYRLAVGAALGTALLLFWVNIAVGVVGSEDNPANRMYFGVLAAFAIGALLARFRPGGMVVALLATALAQALVAGFVAITQQGLAPFDILKALMVNGFFVVLWLASALLFRRAKAAPGS